MTRTGATRTSLLAWVLVAPFLLSFAGCNQPAKVSPTPTAPAAISIPSSDLPADIRCLVENGYRVVGVLEPATPGGPPGYRLVSDLPRDQQDAVHAKCDKLASPAPELTDAEIRVVYDRWVDEYECLVGLGYRPAQPPSFETFLGQWKTGPWDPLQGVDTGSWTDSQYAEAKDRCNLEFFTRG